MSTEIEYMYRDAANYKTHDVVRFAGDITDEQRALIMGSLGGPDGDSFLPGTVGLPTLQSHFSSHYEDDHVWHEICAITIVTEPTHQQETIGEFAERFRDVEWDEAEALAELEAWTQSTPAGQ